jgi:hypothetical protein
LAFVITARTSAKSTFTRPGTCTRANKSKILIHLAIGQQLMWLIPLRTCTAVASAAAGTSNVPCSRFASGVGCSTIHRLNSKQTA